MAQKLKTIILSLSSLLFLGSFFAFATPVLAITCPSGYVHPKDANGAPETNKCDPVKKPGDCPQKLVDKNDPTKCAAIGSACDNQDTASGQAACLKSNPIVKYLNTLVDILSAGVGIIVIGVIIVGGIQYSMAGDNATAVTAAKKRIANGLIALVAYALIFSFLQWIIPGGVFNS